MNDPLHKINWRNLQRINLNTLKQATFDDVNTLMRQNLEDLAYADMSEEQRAVWISHEGMAAMRVMQMGMQYLMHTRGKMVESLLKKEQAVEEQAQYVMRLREKVMEARAKKARCERVKGQLNEQAMHFEVLLNRLSPEILRERMQVVGDKEKEDILVDDQSIFHRILKAKGLFNQDETEFKENKPDYNNISQPNTTVLESQQYEQLTMMKELMENVRQLQKQLDDIKST